MGGFVGRTEEFRYLEAVYAKCPVACAISGRRHSGKTALLREFCKDKPCIYLTGTRSLKDDELARMSAALSEFAGKRVVVDDMEDLFPKLKKVCGKKKTVVVINNFSYLVESFPEMTSYLRMFMSRDINSTKIMLLVSDTDSSIFGRFYYTLDVRSMSYKDCMGFHPDYTPMEHLTVYSLVGGTPVYQSMFDGKPGDVIRRDFFNHMSPFCLEVEGLIGNEPEMRFVSNRVLSAMATGAQSIKDISARADLSTSLCTKAVEDMEHKGILLKEVSSGPSKRAIYSIQSNILRFFYEVIHKYTYQMEFGSSEEAYEMAKPDINRFLEKSFKTVCMDYVALNYRYSFVGKLRRRDDSKDSVVDFVAAVTENNVNCTAVCTCRLFGGQFVEDDLESLRARGKRIAGSNQIYMMFSGAGFSPELRERAEKENGIRLVSLEDVYRT